MSRRLHLPVLSIVLLFAGFMAWGVPTAQAAIQKACYCRYDNPSRLTDSDEKTFCPGEVGFINLVEAGFGDDEEALCQQTCTANGFSYIGPSNQDSMIYAKSSDIVLNEPNHCVFSHYDNNHLPGQSLEISNWSTRYANCKEPLNGIGKSGFSAYPEACSFCFCKFKSGIPDVPASCVGKFTMVHVTGSPSSCPQLCKTLGYDEAGSATKDYADACDYSKGDGCAKPRNEGGAGCKTELENKAIVTKNVLSSGSVVTLPLPLSNVSVPAVIGRIINTIMGVVGALALAMFIWGGLQWMIAAGNPEKVGKAKKTLVWAALGLIAIFSSYAVLNFVISALT